MGSDFSGLVHSVGPQVTDLRPGDAVFGIADLKAGGAFADAVTTDRSHLAPKPDDISFEQAAALATPGVMAWMGLIQRARLAPGQRVFVHGCTGGVGTAVVQLARAHGASVVGTCGPSSLETARGLGLDAVYDYTATPAADLPRLTGRFDVVFDTNGSLPQSAAMRMLTRHGMFLDINATPAKFAHAALFRRHKILICRPSTRALSEAAPHITEPIGRTVPLDESGELIAALERGEHINGKGIILVEPTP